VVANGNASAPVTFTVAAGGAQARGISRAGTELADGPAGEQVHAVLVHVPHRALSQQYSPGSSDIGSSDSPPKIPTTFQSRPTRSRKQLLDRFDLEFLGTNDENEGQNERGQLSGFYPATEKDALAS
jgi:hypothetical protein